MNSVEKIKLSTYLRLETDNDIINQLQNKSWKKCEIFGWPGGTNTFLYSGYVNDPIECVTTSFNNVRYFRYFKFGERNHMEKEGYCGLSCGMTPGPKTISKIDVNAPPIWGEEGKLYFQSKMKEYYQKDIRDDIKSRRIKRNEYLFAPYWKGVRITDDSIILTGEIHTKYNNYRDVTFYFFKPDLFFQDDALFNYFKECYKNSTRKMNLYAYRHKEVTNQYFIYSSVEHCEFLSAIQKDPSLIKKPEYDKFSRFGSTIYTSVLTDPLSIKLVDKDDIISLAYNFRIIIILAAVKGNCHVLKYIAPEIIETFSENDKEEVFLKAVNQDPLCIQYKNMFSSLSQESLEKIIFVAIEENLFVLFDIDNVDKLNVDKLKEAIGKNKVCLSHIHWDKICSDLKLDIGEIVSQNSNGYQRNGVDGTMEPQGFQENNQVSYYKAFVNQDGKNLQYLKDDIQTFEIVKQALDQNGFALQFVTPPPRDNPFEYLEMVRCALKQNPESAKFINADFVENNFRDSIYMTSEKIVKDLIGLEKYNLLYEKYKYSN